MAATELSVLSRLSGPLRTVSGFMPSQTALPDRGAIGHRLLIYLTRRGRFRHPRLDVRGLRYLPYPDRATRATEGVTEVLDDIDHVGIATNDLEAAVERYRTAFGVEPVHRETIEDQGVEEVLFRVGTSYVQLLRALGPDTPVGRFLARRGEGLHHVGFRVRDIHAMLVRIRAAGVPLVDEEPRTGSRGTTVAFVHPEGLGGVLVELVQEPGG
jgi:methylmalonyl-CoA/ethylmalonyl-CoA epimerase